MQMFTIMQQCAQAIINLIYPPLCSACKQFITVQAILCQSCDEKIKPIASVGLSITKTKAVMVHAASNYNDPIKKMILAKLWSDSIAPVHLADIIWQRTVIKYLTFDVLIPVPAHWYRTMRRGFNQAELIAQQLSKHSGKPILLAVKRVKSTRFQSSLEATQRQENVSGVFTMSGTYKQLLEGKHLLIVDDLLTTGATIQEIAKELYKAKPASITVVVAARAV